MASWLGYSIPSIEGSVLVSRGADVLPERKLAGEGVCASGVVRLIGGNGTAVRATQTEESLESKSKRTHLLAHEVGGTRATNYHAKTKTKGKKTHKFDRVTQSCMFTLANGWPNACISSMDNKPYAVVQQLNTPSFLTTSNSGTTFVAASFVVSALDQISSLAAVFDQYRITRIEVWINPSLTEFTTADQGSLATVVDYDDATVLSSYQQALDYENCQNGPPLECHYHSFVPHVAVATYSGTFASYGNVSNQWIDMTSTNVQHYGIKAAATIYGTSVIYDLKARFWMEFRNVR